MRYLFLIIISGFLIGHAFAAYRINCTQNGNNPISALNQTDKHTTQVMVNGNMVNQTTVYDVTYFDNLFNATDCTINQVPDNQVYSGNALLNQQ